MVYEPPAKKRKKASPRSKRARMETRYMRRIRREDQKLRKQVERLRLLTAKGVIPDVAKIPIEKCPPEWLMVREGLPCLTIGHDNKHVESVMATPTEVLGTRDHDMVALPTDYSETEAECTCDSDCDPGKTHY